MIAEYDPTREVAVAVVDDDGDVMRIGKLGGSPAPPEAFETTPASDAGGRLYAGVRDTLERQSR